MCDTVNLVPFHAPVQALSKTIKRRDEKKQLRDSLLSIAEDAKFVLSIKQLYPALPLLANLRCGLWYTAAQHNHTCYFKSTDGHGPSHHDFSIRRLNAHVARLCATKGGALIVDATRRGKRFPDALAKTVPIWACVWNRAIANTRCQRKGDLNETTDSSWDTTLHLPRHVSKNERENIEKRLDEWAARLVECAPEHVSELERLLKKPMRPLWVCQTSYIFTNEVPDPDTLTFAPIVLVSASMPIPLSTSASSDASIVPMRRAAGYVYVPGAGDDEELWCPRGFEAGDLTTFFRAVVTGRNGSCDDDDDDDDMEEEEEEEEEDNNSSSSMYITSGGLANLSAEVAEKVRDRTTFERMMHAYVARKHARGHQLGNGVASSKLPPRLRMLVDPPDIALLLGVRLGHGFDAVEAVSNATTTMSVASGGAVGSTVVFLLQQEEDVKRVVEASASASASAGASVHIRIAHAPWHKRRGRQPLCTAFGDVHAWYRDCRRRGGIFAVACDRPRCEHAVAALLSLILVHGKESRDTDLQRASVSTVLAHVSRALDGAGDDDESSSCASRPPSSAVLKSAFESARRNFCVK
ncbi:hypothetical protein PPROV_000067900 [Pycnococcus provasolii]|uniref:Rit1 N-terminal domain-containing protein n=1 Tax=Pycnococcus provasolii TaxID=41880 RepID=A0A830H5W5_9CHLO|nr:hypothetical protein PPROV_000067900 [Pycnococcus provasolii]